MIKINGKKVTKEEANKFLDDKNTKVTNLSVEIPNTNKTKSKPSHEGFTISQKFISSFSKEKEKMNGSLMAISFLNSPKINNNSLALVVYSPKDLSEEQKKACQVLGINLE